MGIGQLIERRAFELSLDHPLLFRRVLRRLAYLRYKGYRDPENVHDRALELLNECDDILEKHQEEFDFPDLYVKIKGREMLPFGTAGGLDKNGDAITPLSRIFGFLEIGTITLEPRRGKLRPRIAVYDREEAVYNNQEFPSKGVNYVARKLEEHIKKRTRVIPIYANIAGLSDETAKPKAIKAAIEEIKLLVKILDPFVDGFVWNPSSPNFSMLKYLRTPEVFKEVAGAIAEYTPNKVKLVKMHPYEPAEMYSWLDLVGAFIDNGGDGIVGVNTRKGSKRQIPVKWWKYESAGESGRPLYLYRMRAVHDARKAFPDIIILATGAIYDGADVCQTIKAGADGVECYTPITQYGLSLEKLKRQQTKIYLKEKEDLDRLEQLVAERRRLA